MKFLEFGKKDPKRFIKHQYFFECMCVKQSECEFRVRQVVMPYFIKRISLHRCSKSFYYSDEYCRDCCNSFISLFAKCTVTYLDRTTRDLSTFKSVFNQCGWPMLTSQVRAVLKIKELSFERYLAVAAIQVCKKEAATSIQHCFSSKVFPSLARSLWPNSFDDPRNKNRRIPDLR